MDEKYEYSEEQLTDWMQVAEELILEAGKMIKNSIGKAKDVSDKTQFTGEGHSSLILTETDQAVEKMLIAGMKVHCKRFLLFFLFIYPDCFRKGSQTIASSGRRATGLCVK